MGLDDAPLTEGRVRSIRHDDVVKHLDSENLAGFRNLSCHANVFPARFGVAGWVIVRNDDSGALGDNRRAEYVSYRQDRCIERTHAGDVEADHAECRREEYNHDLLLGALGEVRPHQLGDRLRATAAQLVLVAQVVLANELEAVHGNRLDLAGRCGVPEQVERHLDLFVLGHRLSEKEEGG